MSFRTIPKNTTSFGERFVIYSISKFPKSNVIAKLSELSGMCEPLVRKIITRPTPDMNQLRHLVAMCESISTTPRQFERNVSDSIEGLQCYRDALKRIERKQRGLK